MLTHATRSSSTKAARRASQISTTTDGSVSRAAATVGQFSCRPRAAAMHVQSQLTVSARGDPLESEADAIATQMLGIPAPSYADSERMSKGEAANDAEGAAGPNGAADAVDQVSAQENEQLAPAEEEEPAAQEEELAPMEEEEPAAQEEELAPAEDEETAAQEDDTLAPIKDEEAAAQEDETLAPAEEEEPAAQEEELAPAEEEELAAQEEELAPAEEEEPAAQEEELAPAEEEEPAAQEEELAPAEEEEPAAQEEELAPAEEEELAAQEEELAPAEEEEPAAQEEELAPMEEEQPAAAQENEGDKPARLREAGGKKLAPPGFAEEVNALRGGGQPLPEAPRAFMEARFQASFKHIRIHTGSTAARLAKRIRANAFALGRNIFFASGRFQPETPKGQFLLAHELVHTQQQTGEVQRASVSRVQEQVQGFGIRETLSDIAGNIPGYKLATVVMGYEPILGKRLERTPKNFLSGFMGLIIGGHLLFKRLDESGAIDDAFQWLSTAVSKLNISIDRVLALLKQAKDEIGWDIRPSNVLAVAKRVFGPMLRRLLDFAASIGTKIMEFVLRGAIRLAGGPVEKIMALFNKGKRAITALITDPVGFIKNLFSAVKLGLKNFLKNIKKHLLGGLVGWLFGAIAEAGITLPEKWDLKGVFSLVMQILGLTYDNIRVKLVKHLGAKTVERVEKALTFLHQLVTRGPIVLWEKVKASLANLKEKVMGGIRDFVITRVIKEGITWLIGLLNPAGALVKIVKMLVDVVMWLIERWDQIVAFATSVFDSVNAIAAGTIGPAAKAVESALARTVPIIISFLASLLGLGGISGHIKKILAKIRAPIDKAIDKVIGWLVKKGKALIAKLKKKAKAVAGKLVNWWQAKFKGTTKDNKKVSVYFKGKGKSADIKVKASPEEDIDTALADADEINKEYQEAADKESGGDLHKKLVDLMAKRSEAAAKKERIRKEIKVATPPPDPATIKIKMDSLGAKIVKMKNLILDIQENKDLGVAVTKQYSQPTSQWGKQTTAFPLTLQGPRGSPPGGDNEAKWNALSARRSKSGSRTYYIKGHLLNEGLHGKGVWKNMTPLTESANSIHETTVESDVKAAVTGADEKWDLGKHAVYYDIKVMKGPPTGYKERSADEVRADAKKNGWDAENSEKIVNIVAAEAEVSKGLEMSAFKIEKPDNVDWPKKDPSPGEAAYAGFKNVGTISSATVENKPDYNLLHYNPGVPPQELISLNLSKPGSDKAYLAFDEIGPETAKKLNARVKGPEGPFTRWKQVEARIRAPAYKELTSGKIKVTLNSGETKWQDKT